MTSEFSYIFILKVKKLCKLVQITSVSAIMELSGELEIKWVPNCLHFSLISHLLFLRTCQSDDDTDTGDNHNAIIIISGLP